MEVPVIVAGEVGFFALIMASIALHEVGHARGRDDRRRWPCMACWTSVAGSWVGW